jgi:hypothetical protein
LKLTDILEAEPLSKALQRTLRLAQEQGTNELATWLQLELGGYYDTNSAMNADIVVPRYRTVMGAHFNSLGQRLQVQTNLSFINEIRLREGVEVLETLRDTRQTVVLQDQTLIELFAKHLRVEVSTFHFDKVEVVNVLAQIRAALFSNAQMLANMPFKSSTMKAEGSEEVIMLQPNFYGVGINLRSLWRRWTRSED